MSLGKYFSIMESVKFEVLFSIYSSFRHVLAEMAENSTLQGLIDELLADPMLVSEIHARIEHLLVEIQANGDMPRDGCIAGYLYCLWKTDLAKAYDASNEVLKVGGLWWSVQVALKVREYVDEITDSIRTSSAIDEPTEYTMSDRIQLDTVGLLVVELKADAFVIRAEMKDRQLTLLNSACQDSVESDRNEASVSDTTLQYSLAPTRKFVPAVAG